MCGKAATVYTYIMRVILYTDTNMYCCTLVLFHSWNIYALPYSTKSFRVINIRQHPLLKYIVAHKLNCTPKCLIYRIYQNNTASLCAPPRLPSSLGLLPCMVTMVSLRSHSARCHRIIATVRWTRFICVSNVNSSPHLSMFSRPKYYKYYTRHTTQCWILAGKFSFLFQIHI